MRRFFLIVIAMWFIKLSAQETPVKQSIQVSSFIHDGKVMLRWAPNDPILWQRGNKVGYSVYRRTVMRDGKVIEKADSVLIGSFMPKPLDFWKPFADSNYYAIAAEAIYGSGFEVTAQASSNFFDLVNKSREQESRFSIGLLCADKSFAIAKMMGLGLEDLNANKNEAYIYKVVLNFSDSLDHNVVGFAMADYSYGNFLPRPFGINYEVNQNIVTVLVPHDPFKGIYNTYELQRSDDGKSFKTVSDISYYSLSTATDDPKYNVYNDSVTSNVNIVYYRLRGHTSFDTFGPYSDTLEVKIMPTLNGEPWISDIKEVGSGKLLISWESPEYKPEDIKGYMVYSAAKYDGPYLKVLNEPVAKTERLMGVDAPEVFAYFRVGAIDRFDRSYMSVPKLYQAVDSIPPMPPAALIGSFDTTCVANFKWKYGKEKDLLGYQLLYSVNPNAEYSLVSKGFIYDSTCSAKFSKGSLSGDLYFKLVALDMRYNTSQPSEAIKLVKPDTIVPSAPVIFASTDSLGRLSVRIAPSQSPDVKLHTLYAKNDNGSLTELFKGVVKADTTLVFTNYSDAGVVYCVAKDFTNRKGVSKSVRISGSKDQKIEPFKAIAKASIDEGCVNLLWEIKNLNGSLMIYRKSESSGYALIGTVNSEKGKFQDKTVVVNTTYTYKLIAFQKDGKAVSMVVSVMYK